MWVALAFTEWRESVFQWGGGSKEGDRELPSILRSETVKLEADSTSGWKAIGGEAEGTEMGKDHASFIFLTLEVFLCLNNKCTVCCSESVPGAF